MNQNINKQGEDQTKVKRMLREMVLLTNNCILNVSQIAERVDTPTRNVYRDLNTFRDAGFVVKKNGEIYSLEKSSPHFKEISELIHFSEEEAYILKAAIESIDDTNLIKQNLKKKLSTIYNYKILAETIVKPKYATSVKNLADAIFNKKQVILHDYASAHGDNTRNRLAEPFEFTTNYVQIWCYDLESGTNKLFKLARIGGVEVLEHGWQEEERHEAGFIDVFRMHTERQYHVQLRMNVRAANLLTEEYPLAERDMSKLDENHWLLDTRVCAMEGIGRFVMGLINDIEVIKSKDLICYLKLCIKNSGKKFKK